MPKSGSGTALDLAELLASWELHLRAERKSAQTVKNYGDGGAPTPPGACHGTPPTLDRRPFSQFMTSC